MKTDELLDRFTKSLENMSDENFAKLLDEMENDPQGQGITIGEFMDSLNYKYSIDEIISFSSKNQVNYSSIINDFLKQEPLINRIISFDSKNQVNTSIINDILNKESLIKEKIKINQSKVSYFSSNTMQEIDVKNENLLNAA